MPTDFIPVRVCILICEIILTLPLKLPIRSKLLGFCQIVSSRPMTAWLLAMRSFLFFYAVTMLYGDGLRHLRACHAAALHHTLRKFETRHIIKFLEVLLCTIAHYISFSQKTFLTLTPHVQVTAYHLLQRAMKVG